MRRNHTKALNCNEKLFFQLVKAGFGQRRKMLRSSVKSFIRDEELKQDPIFSKRPEQLSVNDFERLTRLIEGQS